MARCAPEMRFPWSARRPSPKDSRQQFRAGGLRISALSTEDGRVADSAKLSRDENALRNSGHWPCRRYSAGLVIALEVTASSPPQPESITRSFPSSARVCTLASRGIMAIGSTVKSLWNAANRLDLVTGRYSQVNFSCRHRAAILAYSLSGSHPVDGSGGGDHEYVASSRPRARSNREAITLVAEESRPPLRWEAIGNAERSRHSTDWRNKYANCSA